MKNLLLSGVALLSMSLSVSAQELVQQDNAWFAAGKATIDARLAVNPITGKAKNVILFTSDGQGVGSNYAIRLFSGQLAGGLGDDYVQPFEAFPYSALVKTYSTNGQTPDSAPTATAMNSGVKTKNDLINIADSVAVSDCAALAGNELTTFAEIASGMGKSVGVLSTARVTHATPAAVYAKTVNRDWEDNTFIPEGCAQLDIAAQLIEMLKSGVIDIAMGGGRSHFLPTTVTDGEGKEGKRTDGRNLPEEVVAMGGQVATNQAEFMALTMGGNAPVLGLFEASHMQYEHDRTDEPSIAEMTEAAITALSANENGFYLAVEGGRVDHASHGGNLYRALTDGKAFADAVAKAIEMTDPNETLIIVTADHEHAIAFNGYCGRGTPIHGLCYEVNEAGVEHLPELAMAADGKPYSVTGYLNGPGSVLVEQADKTFFGTRPVVTAEEAIDPDYLQQAMLPMSSETHSGEDVSVMANGPWAHLFGGVIEQNVIFHVMHHAITAE